MIRQPRWPANNRAGSDKTITIRFAGIDELTVPPIEPLIIPKMQMENGHGAVRVRAILSNMTIHGASNYTVLNVR